MSKKSSTNKANSEASFIILIWIPKYSNLKLENNSLIYLIPVSKIRIKNYAEQ